MGRVKSQGLMVSWTGKTSFLVPLLHIAIPCSVQNSGPLSHHLAWLQGHWTHLVLPHSPGQSGSCSTARRDGRLAPCLVQMFDECRTVVAFSSHCLEEWPGAFLEAFLQLKGPGLLLKLWM